MCNGCNDEYLECAENVSNISPCHLPLIPTRSGGVDVQTFRQPHNRTERMYATYSLEKHGLSTCCELH